MRDALGDVRGVLILGGRSEIGVAIARRLVAPGGARVVLAARDPARLGAETQALLEAGATAVDTLEFDATDTAAHDRVIQQAAAWLGRIDVAVVAFGLLGDQKVDEAGGGGAVEVATVNYVGAVSTGLALARYLRAQGHGQIVFLSSVAGERVRRANFIYGSTKAGMDGFAQGLSDALKGSGVDVLIVRPGFVRGRMTEGRETAPMATTAEAVAAVTVAGLKAGKRVVWAPAILRFAFLVFRHLPQPLWRRLAR